MLLLYLLKSDYRTHFWYMSKDDALSIMNNSSLNEKTGLLDFLFIIYKTLVEQLIINETEK